MATYFVTADGVEHQVEVEPLESGTVVMRRDGDEKRIDAWAIAEKTLSLLIDGVSYDVDVDVVPRKAKQGQPGEALRVRVVGEVVPVEVLDARARNMREVVGAAGTQSGRQQILSPMPGKVIKLLVAPGTSVKAGQGLIVVEAMKMENEIQSPADGKVAELRAVAGQAVEAGAVLMIVE